MWAKKNLWKKMVLAVVDQEVTLPPSFLFTFTSASSNQTAS
jgi:hypothetical protein